MTISSKFCSYWANGFRQEDFYENFSSETTGPIAIKLLWNDPWMAPFQNCVRWSRLPTKMATKLKIEKRGMKFKKNLLLWNYCANLNQTLLKWSYSTKLWLQLALWFLRRRFLCEFPIGFSVKLSSAVAAILIEGPNRRTHFWKRTIQWLFHQNFVPHKNLLLRNHRANCNQSFVEWSLDGPLPKLCPVIPTSNQDGRQAKNRKKWGKNLKKWLFYQSLVPIEQLVPDKRICMWISHRFLC
jgi:hypothetical protein